MKLKMFLVTYLDVGEYSYERYYVLASDRNKAENFVREHNNEMENCKRPIEITEYKEGEVSSEIY